MKKKELKNKLDHLLLPEGVNPTISCFVILHKQNRLYNIHEVKKLNINNYLLNDVLKDVQNKYKPILKRWEGDKEDVPSLSDNLTEKKGCFINDINVDHIIFNKITELQNMLNNGDEVELLRKRDIEFIKGVIIQIGDGNKSCFIFYEYKKPIIYRHKAFWKMKGNQLETVSVSKDLLILEPRIDFIYYKDVFFIVNCTAAKKIPEVKEKYDELAASKANEIKSSVTLAQATKTSFDAKCSEDSFKERLLKIETINSSEKIKSFVEGKGRELNLNISFENDTLKVEDGQEDKMLGLVNDDYLHSPLSDNWYHVDGRKTKLN